MNKKIKAGRKRLSKTMILNLPRCFYSIRQKASNIFYSKNK